MNNQEVITMYDKDKRDAMYEDLRKNGDKQERQVVRFSGYELRHQVRLPGASPEICQGIRRNFFP